MSLKDKEKIEELLRTYSINDISQKFVHIDKCLVSLHKCSANDFLQLNEDFQKLFNQLKIISNNFNDVINQLSQSNTDELYQQTKLFCKSLYDNLICNKKKIGETKIVIEKIFEQFKLIFFPIKNCSQNLMILKYLLTNFKILLPSHLINNDKALLIEKEINLISEKISNCLSQLNNLSSLNFSFAKRATNNRSGALFLDIIAIIKTLEEKYTSNKERLLQIEIDDLNSDKSMSDIVKKLQYHDIIRQKMEHIQKTHQDIIKELSLFNNDVDDEKYLLKKAEFFLKIRDIAGIQAAQLIQANKEYQNAIETIINNFVLILNNIELLKRLTASNNDKSYSEQDIFRSITDKVNKSEEIYNKEYESYLSFYDEINTIIKHIEKSQKYFTNISNFISNYKSHITDYIKHISSNVSVDENINNAIEQINNLISELESNYNVSHLVFQKLIAYKNEEIKELAKENDCFTIVDFDDIKNSVSLLKQNKDLIENIYLENQSIGSSSLNQIKKSIDEIKYYDYFENVIEEIIEELNTINYNLRKNNEIETLSDNLSKLKKYYTIESEHFIHDKISNGEEIIIDDKDNGEIEFF
ncbi:MAG: hypothetical protein MI739_11720 [Bacteroidales bacterium]|nr:hypothetical protein [Bacteroidales bacterium]